MIINFILSVISVFFLYLFYRTTDNDFFDKAVDNCKKENPKIREMSDHDIRRIKTECRLVILLLAIFPIIFIIT